MDARGRETSTRNRDIWAVIFCIMFWMFSPLPLIPELREVNILCVSVTFKSVLIQSLLLPALGYDM